MHNKPSSPFPDNSALAAPSASTRVVIKPMALLDVVRRRGRSWGLLAQYEESRLGLPR